MLSSDGGGVAGEGARLVSTERDLELGSPLPTRDTTPASQLLSLLKYIHPFLCFIIWDSFGFDKTKIICL